MKLKAIWPSGKAVDCKSSIPSSNLGVALIWGYGGMVDTTDLKSVDLISREGSSPSTPKNLNALYFHLYFVALVCIKRAN